MSNDKYDELHDHIMASAREYLALCKSGMVCWDDESEEGQSVFKITRLQADLVVARKEIADLRAENEKKLIYLGCPYSHPNPHVKTQRFEAVTKVASKMMAKGEFVFSPISHTHPIAMVGNLPGGWEFWKAYDEIYLRMSRKMIVLMLDGWQESVGLTAEIELSKKLGIEVEYMAAQIPRPEGE
jgi:hypothetical protein